MKIIGHNLIDRAGAKYASDDFLSYSVPPLFCVSVGKDQTIAPLERVVMERRILIPTMKVVQVHPELDVLVSVNNLVFPVGAVTF